MRRWSSLCAGIAVVAGATSAAAADYVTDPLTDAAFPGRGSQGGTFAADGWTTTGGTDAIWYEIADALPTGSVSFSVRGVSTATSLSGADHDIFTIYQAPTGQAEPVAYSPYYRNNDFKAFTRIFGVQEPNRAGAMKLELVLCPRGDPWYHDDACPPECGKNDLAYANGSDTDIGWDAATWYSIAVSWGNGTISFSRDGGVLGTIAYAGTYAPQPLRVRLGSPRHGVSDVAYMPVGLTFKDVGITGDPGAMTPVCVPEVPDGGAPDAGGDGGTTSGELAAIQDVTAASWAPSTVFDDVTDLNVEGDGAATATGVVYLRFPVPSGDVKKALLRLRTHAFGSAAGGSGVVYAVSDTSWTETTLTWDNRPTYGTLAYGTAQAVAPDSDVEWDVTGLVAAGTVDFALVSTDADGAHYVSKEMGGPVTGPRLYVEADPASGGGGSGAAGSGGDGSGASGAGGGGEPWHGNAATDAAGDSSGCGCRVAGAASGGWVAALALASLLRRRRRRD